jgi:DNA-binding CsgD family transcriptional regulator
MLDPRPLLEGVEKLSTRALRVRRFRSASGLGLALALVVRWRIGSNTMSISEVGAAVGAIHMRVVYFMASKESQTFEADPRLTPREQQILGLVAEGNTTRDIARLLLATERTVKAQLAGLYRKLDVASGSEVLARAKERAHSVVPAHLTRAVRQLELLIEYAPLVMPETRGRGGLVTVVSARMDSPLEVVLEIPAVAWPGIAIGLLALAERITTTPVRIARNRKEKLLEIAILDKQIELVKAGRADALAQLLLREGPRPATSSGPYEIAFVDPDHPDEDLDELGDDLWRPGE